ncbi:MAG: hypothetical protein WC007_16155, partial [Pelobacteraceae bacterium]
VLAQSDRDEYLKLTEEAVYDFLQHPENAAILHADPTGEKALATAAAMRKNLRLLYKSGRISKEEGMEQVEALRKKLRAALHKPELLVEFHSGKLKRYLRFLTG